MPFNIKPFIKQSKSREGRKKVGGSPTNLGKKSGVSPRERGTSWKKKIQILVMRKRKSLEGVENEGRKRKNWDGPIVRKDLRLGRIKRNRRS